VTELILALDLTDPAHAGEVAAACAPFLDAIKIGYPLVLPAGLAIADSLVETGLPLIADFKVADIPNTSRLIAEEVFRAGYEAIICHGFTGRDTVRACVETAHVHEGSCYVVAEMSHPGSTEFFQGDVPARIAEIAMECGADGIIAPGTRPDRVAILRDIVGRRKIYAPGIGAQGGESAALAGLVDGIIVGRAIYEASDPAAAAEVYAGICR
jgi:orotidine-5'-phosphate decarboxylase